MAHRRPLGPPLTGHTGAVYSAAFSPNGKLLASGSEDHTIRLWDVASGQPRGTLPTSYVSSLAFSPGGKLLASRNADHTIRLWDLDVAS